VRIVSYRYQRTLARPAQLTGIGFGTGATIQVRFLPAPPSTGILFQRADLHPSVRIPARVDQVTVADRRTALGTAPRWVALTEHVLSALRGLRIDNCVVELNCEELPGLDGSAQPYVDALLEAGMTLQSARVPVWAADTPICAMRSGATLTLFPDERPGLRVSYILDYGPLSVLGRQPYTLLVTPESYVAEIANCRTFILESEAALLFSKGIIRTGRLPDDLIVFGKQGPLNHRLRYLNEPVRHKILDLLGDLALLGCDLSGHLVAYRSGHRLNVEFAQILARNMSGATPLRRAA
jgi:UDP-3-O-acyl N-acetylglucosamine deacetylase